MPFPKKGSKEEEEEEKHVGGYTNYAGTIHKCCRKKTQTCKCGIVFHILKKNVIQNAVCQHLHARNNFIH